MISSFDLKVIIDELINDYAVVGMKVDKVYKIGDELRVKLYGRGRQDLILKPGTAVFVTSYPKVAPQHPAGFAMQLRKHLAGLRILSIEQLGFDRIAKITFGLFGEEQLVKYYVYVEVFGNGNLILTDPDDNIIGVLLPKAWATRTLRARAVYEPPPSQVSPYDADVASVIDGKTPIVKALAMTMNMGGMYAEEICIRAGIDKQDPSPDPEALARGISDVLALAKAPAIVNNAVVPYNLKIHEGKERVAFERLNQATDEIYGKWEMEKIAAKELTKQEKHINKLERILSTQLRTIGEYEKKRSAAQLRGNAIFAHYQLVDNLLTTLYGAVKSLGWKEVASRMEHGDAKLRGLVVSMDQKTGRIIVKLGDDTVELDITKSINENAQDYYTKSKKFKRKLEGAAKAVEISNAKIEKARTEDAPVAEVKKRVQKKRKWYERYRWFRSSDGFLVIGGRDAATNETLVKRYLEEGDIHIHADITGAPQVIIKDGANAPETTIEEAGIFAVTFSKAWKLSVSSLDAYWVNPDQVTKEPPTGEFLGKGAFFIKGKKNYLRKLPVDVSIGVYQDSIMCGPSSAVSAKCEQHFKIVPGRESKEKTAKRLMELLSWDDVNDIVQSLPPGGCEIV